MKKLQFGILGVLITCSMAMGFGFEMPAIMNAAPGSSLVIPISESGSFATQGVNLCLEVTGPLQITGVGLDAGTIWDGNTAPNYNIFGDTAFATTTTTSGSVTVPGIVALVTVTVPAGTANGDYLLRPYIPSMGLNSLLGGWENLAWPPEDAPWLVETIIRVPEPATALLLIAAIPLLRRRHA